MYCKIFICDQIVIFFTFKKYCKILDIKNLLLFEKNDC